MKHATKGKLKRYLTAHARKYLLLTGILYVGILSILLFPISFSENVMAWFGGYVACPLICVFLTRTLVRAHLSVKRQLDGLESDGILEKGFGAFYLLWDVRNGGDINQTLAQYETTYQKMIDDANIMLTG